jgi:chromosome segregation ATPase
MALSRTRAARVLQRRDRRRPRPDALLGIHRALLRHAPRVLLAIALGALSVLLLVIIFALWSRVGSRDDTISQIKNRSDQLQVDTIQLQSQVAEDKVARGVLQKHMDDAQAASISDKADSDKANAASVELQRTLDKTRIIATDFQSQMENAKVASIKHQGEVDIAQAQTAVMQIQLNKATADTGQLQAQLADLRGRFEASEAMVAQLEKAKAKD